ncbi:acyl-CoA dehydrogenase family protein [Streptomyces sp. NPDC012888]|uniref:acyl-CoA dehydrogenase family protein n=1 Tax=Streptomyces sp. NPDC012888 TaxID=3364855 RepID=UPI0036B647F2
MRFLLTGEQSAYASTVRSLLAAAEVPAAARAWAAGDPAPGLAVWRRLAGTGLFALAAAEAYDGLGPLPVELAAAFVELGRAAMPGPLVETAVAVVLLSELGDEAPAKRFLPALTGGEAPATLTLPGGGPYALDAAVAGYRFAVSADELRLAPPPGESFRSTDPARQLSVLPPGGELLASGAAVRAAAGTALRWARLLTAAQCVGVGEALLARTVAYAGQREQFGTPIGAFQAVKHRLADVLLGLEFAKPLLWAAALPLGRGDAGPLPLGRGDAGALPLGRGDTAATPRPGRGDTAAALTLGRADTAMAKLAAGEAAYAAAGAALQVHGAVGYTEELDLSLWLRKSRPLRDAWGTPATCRAEILPTPR